MKECILENLTLLQNDIESVRKALIHDSVQKTIQYDARNLNAFNEQERIKAEHLEIGHDAYQRLRDVIREEAHLNRVYHDTEYGETQTTLEKLKTEASIQTEQTLYNYRMKESQRNEYVNSIGKKRKKLVQIQAAITSAKRKLEQNERKFQVESEKYRREVSSTQQMICTLVNGTKKREKMNNEKVFEDSIHALLRQFHQ